MDPAVIAVVEECTAASDAGRKAFPSVIADLAAAGVERYHADLIRADKIYFWPDGSAHVTACAPLDAPPAPAFAAAGIEAAVRAAQAGAVDYRGFCAMAAAAGCVGYHVSLPGARAVYYGRTAEMHVEHFPD